MSEELKSCPFCGGEAEIIEGPDGESAYVQCHSMKMHRAIWFSGDNNASNEVREQWNRRALEAPADRVEKLEAALTKLRTTAATLQQNAIGCVTNHFSGDYEEMGLPGWLIDTQRDIDDAAAILTEGKPS
jgi:hypothetical protein